MRERLSLGAMTLGFAVAYALIGLFKHWHFDSSAFDLGIFDQAVWHLSRFEVPASTISGHANVLGDHFYPILVVLAPLYWIAPAPETLIAAQAVLLAASIVPVYLFVRARVPMGPALVLTAAYASFWGMQRTAWFDFHEMAFAPLFVAAAVLAIDRRRWTQVWLASAALVLVKEDLIPLVCGFGLYLMLTGERRRGASLAIAGLAAFLVVVLILIPWFNGAGVWVYGSGYEAVWDRPWMAPLLMFTPVQKLRTVVFWLAPFLFLPVASPWGLLLVPVAAERLLSVHQSHWGHGFHYSAPLAPILAMAAADGLARLARFLQTPSGRRRAVMSAAAGALIVSTVLPGHQPILRLFAAKHYRRPPFHDVAIQALAVIPPGASVVAQAAIAPHLSQRTEIFVLDGDAPDAEYVVASRDLSPWPEADPEDIARLIDQRKIRGYRPLFERDGWVVLQR